jgi:hypothetical protein
MQFSAQQSAWKDIDGGCGDDYPEYDATIQIGVEWLPIWEEPIKSG